VLVSQKKHYDVLIATPGSSLNPEYVTSLLATIEWLTANGYTYKWLNKYSSFIPSAREITALDQWENDWKTREVGAGKFTYGKIFWIDSDISWDVEMFEKIFKSDLDIVGGLYRTDPMGTVACAFFDAKRRPTLVGENSFFMQEDPIEVFGLGFGFIAMKQGVFESCDRPWFRIQGVQWDELDFECNVGEDYSWCMNARKNGFQVYVDPTVKVKHHKETIYLVR
jgi:GT2 family glycosyltransferase